VPREVTATGTTRAAAERALRDKLVERVIPTEQLITADTTVAKLAKLWLQYLRDEGRIENTTINEYERVLTKVIVPELGGVRLRELTTSRLDMFLVALRAISASRQRKTNGHGRHAWSGSSTRRSRREPHSADVTHPPGEVRDPVADARGPRDRPDSTSNMG